MSEPRPFRSIGNRLKVVREGNGMTQIELADAVGISVKSVTLYETGVLLVPSPVLKTMRSLFMFSIDHVLTGQVSTVDPQALRAFCCDLDSELDASALSLSSADYANLLLSFSTLMQNGERVTASSVMRLAGLSSRSHVREILTDGT